MRYWPAPGWESAPTFMVEAGELLVLRRSGSFSCSGPRNQPQLRRWGGPAGCPEQGHRLSTVRAPSPSPWLPIQKHFSGCDFPTLARAQLGGQSRGGGVFDSATPTHFSLTPVCNFSGLSDTLAFKKNPLSAFSPIKQSNLSPKLTVCDHLYTY